MSSRDGSPKPKSRVPPAVPKKPAVAAKPKLHVDVNKRLGDGDVTSANASKGRHAPPPRPTKPPAGPPAHPPTVKPPAHSSGPPKPPRSPASTLTPGFSLPIDVASNGSISSTEVSSTNSTTGVTSCSQGEVTCSADRVDDGVNTGNAVQRNMVKELANKLSGDIKIGQPRPSPRKRSMEPTAEVSKINVTVPTTDVVDTITTDVSKAFSARETTPHAPPRHKRKSQSPLKEIKKQQSLPETGSPVPKPAKQLSLDLEKGSEVSSSTSVSVNQIATPSPTAVRRQVRNKPPPPPKPFLRSKSKSTEDLHQSSAASPLVSTKPATLDKTSRRRSRSLGDLMEALHADTQGNGLETVIERHSLITEELASPEVVLANTATEQIVVQTNSETDLKENEASLSDVSTNLEDSEPSVDKAVDITKTTGDLITAQTSAPSEEVPPSANSNNECLVKKGDAKPAIQPKPRPRGKKIQPSPKERQPPASMEATGSAEEHSSPETDNQRQRTESVPVITTSATEHLDVKPRSDSQSSSSSDGRRSYVAGNLVRKGSKLLSQFKQSIIRKNSTKSESDHSSKNSSIFYFDVDGNDIQPSDEDFDRPLSVVSVFSEAGSDEKLHVNKPLPTRPAPVKPPESPTKVKVKKDEKSSVSKTQQEPDSSYDKNAQTPNKPNISKQENSRPQIVRPSRPAPPPPNLVKSTPKDATQTPSGEKTGKVAENKMVDNSRKDSNRSSKSSTKSDRSNKSRKRSARRSGIKYDSLGYMKPRSNSAGDVEDGHCYADIDSSDDEQKPRSSSDTSGMSGHIYEPIDSRHMQGIDTDIYQDIDSGNSDNNDEEKEQRLSVSLQPLDLSPPVPPPRNRRMRSLFQSQLHDQASASDTNPEDNVDNDKTNVSEDEYVLPEEAEEDNYMIHEPDEDSSDVDSYHVTPRMRLSSGRHSLRECEYIDMTGRTFSRDNLLATLQEQHGGTTSTDNTTTDPATTSSEEDEQTELPHDDERANNVHDEQTELLGDDESVDEEQNKEAVKKHKIFCIAEEIMTSEGVFVDVLRLLNVDFRHAVDEATAELDCSVIPARDLNTILNYLPQLQRFSQELLSDLTRRIEHWDEDPRVADIFVRIGPFLKLYTSYIKDYSATMQALEEACKKYPHFLDAVKKFQMSERCAKLALGHYMLKPIQRIPQYKMLLTTYHDKLAADSPDLADTKVALKVVSEVADHANESMRDRDNQRKLLEVKERLVGDFEVVQPGRAIIREGDLMKMSRKEMQPRRFFLFNDILLHTTPMTIGAYKINNKLSLAGMKVVKPVQEDFQNEFSIISMQRSFTLAASSPKERDDWIADLTNTIKEFIEKRTTFKRQTNALSNLPEQAEDFVLGSTAPVWIPDTRVTMCMLCVTEFTMTFRRHHCRSCGKVVCGPCSDYKAPLQYLKYKPNRVCADCFDKLQEEFGKLEGTFTAPESPGGTVINLKELFVNKGLRKSEMKSKKKTTVLQEVCATDIGAMSGYLKEYVKGKKWKKLWFVVKDKVLYTYRASEDMAAIESLPLLGFEITTVTENYEGVEPSLLFQITHQGRPPMILKTESAVNTEKWIQIMKEATVP